MFGHVTFGTHFRLCQKLLLQSRRTDFLYEVLFFLPTQMSGQSSCYHLMMFWQLEQLVYSTSISRCTFTFLTSYLNLYILSCIKCRFLACYHFLLFFPGTHTSCSSLQSFTQSLASDSAVGLYLLQNPAYAQYYDGRRLSILAQGRSPFHLSAFKVTFIETSNPALCRQKEFVYSLKIVH